MGLMAQQHGDQLADDPQASDTHREPDPPP
jgi:hypothetical protein